ncbi:hypothetical protein CVT24_001354 [Panaeolus cyanescens]|uniref:UBA domain-containing protein n=1 Tax=Panaeolus cyanescens TaxID=181874 RepID=A0A409YFZ1_9AGAR|nr:hypothetical protein CVT24_001354 [Panaeolus cyanescens]
MASDFSDLWTSSAPKTKPQTLGNASSVQSTQSTRPNGQNSAMGYGKPDVFALLASSSTTTTINRNGSSSASTSSHGGPISTSRMGTPSLPAQGSRTSTPSLRTPAGAASGGGMDAFSDLFAGTTTTKTTNMTLADRLAQEQKGRPSGMGTIGRGTANSSISNSSTTQASSSDAWAGLDSLAGGSLGLGSRIKPQPAASSIPSLTKSAGTAQTALDDDDWGLGDFGTASSTKPTTTAATHAVAPTATRNTSSSKSLWDLGDFASPSPAPSTSSHIKPPQATQPISRTGSAQSQTKAKPKADDFGIFDSPEDDFDFGNREDGYQQPGRSKSGRGGGLLDFDQDDDDEGGGIFLADERTSGRGGDEDDILGMLAKPVEEVKSTTRTPATPSSSHRSPPPAAASRAQAGRTPSPPPHLIGQLVEMGFPVVDARTALLITMKQDGSGFDVAAAAENLLGGQSSGRQGVSSVRREERPPQRPIEDAPRGPPKGRREREREREERERRKQREQAGDGDVVADIQIQADKLIAQASEIGLNVFSKASAFWNQGKEKVVKAYEERQSGAEGSQRAGYGGGGGGRSDGRPKWMTRDGDDHDTEPVFDSGFKDDTSPPNSAKAMFGERGPPRRADRVKRPSTPPPQLHSQNVQEPEIDLFSSSEPTPSASRAPPPPNRRPQAASRAPSFTPTQAPPPPPLRSLVSASPSSISAALKHRNSGTEAFKLGQFGSAVEAYTLAIQSLPAGHLLLVPLYNNRALGRLKTGEHKAAGEDAGRVISLILGETVTEESFDPTAGDSSANSAKAGSWSPASEHPSILQAAQAKANGGGWEHAQGLGVDLVDGFVKAVKRRAEAWEGREKWQEAGRDWELLAGALWVGDAVKKEAVRGAGRCRNMASGGGSAPSVSNGAVGGSGGAAPSRQAVKPKPKPKPIPVQTSNAALRAHQATTRQAEEEDNQKHALKDVVDAKLAAWRTGKETNIRALLASLDLVLWEELLKGVKVGGLSELVMPAQVKKGYMKAIARVHPDKLNASNSTLEQRMLANGVFGTLNEAWIAFQATQK